jgi:hypothetical protein
MKLQAAGVLSVEALDGYGVTLHGKNGLIGFVVKSICDA